MNAVTRIGDARPERRPRFPVHPIAGLAGTSLKHEHLLAIEAEGLLKGFFEVHAENYMGAGGAPHRSLERVRSDYPLSLHGVCMSIGGSQPLDREHLRRFCSLVERYEPALVSEHLAWSTHETTFFNDLLPLPYTPTTLSQVAAHIEEVQDAIRRPILLENPSTYIAFREFDDDRNGLHPCSRPPHWLRPAARRQQRLRLCDEPGLRRARLPRRFPTRTCGRGPFGRTRRAD